jgi:PAP_fibrillin
VSLTIVVVTVAGTSQLLDPKGVDVLGINIPLGEFLNSGTFETTYMDDSLRISRGKLGLVEQLRVFTRTSKMATVEAELLTQEASGDDTPTYVELVENNGEIKVNGSGEKTLTEEKVEGEEMMEPPESNRI